MAKMYVITGLNVLSGRREKLSLPMEFEQAEMRLAREQAARRYKHHLTHKKLRVDLIQPEQLTIKF